MKFVIGLILLLTSLVAFGQTQLRTDKVIIGRGTAGNKEIIFDNAQGSANPRLRYNNANDKVEFSTDGVTYNIVASANAPETLQEKTLETLKLSSALIPGAASILDLSSDKSFVILTGTTATTLSGIAGGEDGKVITVLNGTTADAIVKSEDVAAAAGDRLKLSAGSQLKLKRFAAIDFIYSANDSRWVVKGGSGSGSGSGGEINFIVDGDAEGSNPFTVSKNTVAGARPDIGFVTTGTTITTDITSSNPLNGDYSFTWNKPASNAQGEQIYVPFTIPAKYKAKVLTISTSYRVLSGTFTAGTPTSDSDVIVYIAALNPDTAQWELIEPSSIKLLSQSSTLDDIMDTTFQTTANATSYRLIYHVATTNATAWSLKTDDIKVSPSKYATGTPITEWAPYTPTGSWTANVVYQGRWRRVGSSAEVINYMSLSGAPNAATLTVNNPPGLTTDSGGIIGGTDSQIGTGSYLDNSSFYGIAGVFYANPTSVQIRATSQVSPHSLGQVNQTNPVTWASGDSLGFRYTIPVVGFGASTKMSDSADTRVVAARVSVSSNQALTTSLATLQLNTVSFDTHGGFNAGNYRYYVPVAGYYSIKAKFLGPVTSTNDTLATTILHNSTTVSQERFYKPATIAERVSGLSATTVWANVGDYFEIQASLNPAGSLVGGSQNNYITVERVSGPSAIAASETIAARYSANSGQSIAHNTDTTILYNNKHEDTHGAFNTATGEFTAPAGGNYAASCVGTLASSAWTTGQWVEMRLKVNNSSQAHTFSSAIANGTTIIPSGPVVLQSLRLNQGDKVKCNLMHQRGSSTSLDPSSAYSHFSIHRIGL